MYAGGSVMGAGAGGRLAGVPAAEETSGTVTDGAGTEGSDSVGPGTAESSDGPTSLANDGGGAVGSLPTLSTAASWDHAVDPPPTSVESEVAPILPHAVARIATAVVAAMILNLVTPDDPSLRYLRIGGKSGGVETFGPPPWTK